MKTIFKRTLCILACFALILSLCACTEKQKPLDNGENTGKDPGENKTAEVDVEVIPGRSYSGPDGTGTGDGGIVRYSDKTAAPEFAPIDDVHEGFVDGGFVVDGFADGRDPTDIGILPGEGGEGENGIPVQAGLMTAGAKNDNDNFDDWLELFKSGQTDEDAGKFFGLNKQGWKLDTLNRVRVTVTNGGTPVANALVKSDDFAAVTDANGVAYLFTSAQSGFVTVKSGEHTAEAELGGRSEINVELSQSEQKGDVIDLMFVVDVTGSMGDEISYLQAEMTDVIEKVAQNNPAAAINLAFLFYRDEYDAQEFYVVNFKDVTDKDNLDKQVNELKKQRADGGDDYPEALDEALEMAVGKTWSENSTKILFLVLDAPAHEEDENKTRYSNAVKTAAEKGIRVCPVLASGADDITEYLTRSAAILTGGTFVYITDHSGIGGGHHDPDLPEVVIERLNRLLIRLINGYHSGTFAKPVAWTDEQ